MADPMPRAGKPRYEFPCCEHCDCDGGERVGHDDTCLFGCNDEQLKER